MSLDKRRQKIRVGRYDLSRRESVCKSTDFWYSSMRAVCKHFPDRRVMHETKNYILSTIVAIPMPPPTHSVASP
jgi:hypothetical protein